MKLRHDFAGHYNRLDIFQLHINRAAPHIYDVHNDLARVLPAANADALAAPIRLLAADETARGEANTGEVRPRASTTEQRGKIELKWQSVAPYVA